LPTHLAERGAQQADCLRLALLHLAPESLNQRNRVAGERYHDRLRWGAGVQVEFAQFVERADCPLGLRRQATEPKLDRLGPHPEETAEHSVIGPPHEHRDLIRLGIAVHAYGETRDVDRIGVLLALDPEGSAAIRLDPERASGVVVLGHPVDPAGELVATDQ
jgi:hypothetical protein